MFLKKILPQGRLMVTWLLDESILIKISFEARNFDIDLTQVLFLWLVLYLITKVPLSYKKLVTFLDEKLWDVFFYLYIGLKYRSSLLQRYAMTCSILHLLSLTYDESFWWQNVLSVIHSINHLCGCSFFFWSIHMASCQK